MGQDSSNCVWHIWPISWPSSWAAKYLLSPVSPETLLSLFFQSQAELELARAIFGHRQVVWTVSQAFKWESNKRSPRPVVFPKIQSTRALAHGSQAMAGLGLARRPGAPESANQTRP